MVLAIDPAGLLDQSFRHKRPLFSGKTRTENWDPVDNIGTGKNIGTGEIIMITENIETVKNIGTTECL